MSQAQYERLAVARVLGMRHARLERDYGNEAGTFSSTDTVESIGT